MTPHDMGEDRGIAGAVLSSTLHSFHSTAHPHICQGNLTHRFLRDLRWGLEGWETRWAQPDTKGREKGVHGQQCECCGRARQNENWGETVGINIRSLMTLGEAVSAGGECRKQAAQTGEWIRGEEVDMWKEASLKEFGWEREGSV